MDFIELAAVCTALATPSLGLALTPSDNVETVSRDEGIGATLSALTRTRVDVVVFDERYDEAVQFAAELEQAGAVALATRGEIVTQWRECPTLAERSRRLRIAGLTLHSDFELLRSFSAAMGLRVLHEGRHTRRAGGEVRHSLSCIRNEEFVAACGSAQWSRQLARAMSNTRPSKSSSARAPDPPIGFRVGTLTSCLLG